MKNIMRMSCSPDVGMLLIRLAVGSIFIAHGWAKFQNMDATVAFFGSLGISAMLAYVVSGIELLGGILMVLGLWTSVAGGLLAVVMLGAYVLVKSKLPFMAAEIDIALFAASLGVAFAGPGKYSLGKKVCDCTTCTDSGCTCLGCKK